MNLNRTPLLAENILDEALLKKLLQVSRAAYPNPREKEEKEEPKPKSKSKLWSKTKEVLRAGFPQS